MDPLCHECQALTEYTTATMWAVANHREPADAAERAEVREWAAEFMAAGDGAACPYHY